MKNTPIILMILDGWGYSENSDHNAICAAHTPQWDNWWKTQPHILLDASGTSVGLPLEQMGNSEVGHMHIGAGRIIPQDYTRINNVINSGELSHNIVLTQTINKLKQQEKALHIMGLLSPGGVHSHEQHLFALLDLCTKQNLQKINLHLFLDGRDTPPQSAIESFHKLNAIIQQNSNINICSISGRYYAMDRDHRWQRIAPVYNLITSGVSDNIYPDAIQAINAYYAQNITDEFIPPTRIGTSCPMQDGDAILFFNFRSDRAQQLTEAFINPKFAGFARTTQPKLTAFISMTQYGEHLNTTPMFAQNTINNTLGEIIAQNNLKQLRIAETEKYAHVTFFFNGGEDRLFHNEDRIFIKSPTVATYDLCPSMSAQKITDEIINAINTNKYDIIICNYANADMVGHTGNFQATIEAIEVLDQSMQRVWQALSKVNGKLLITADHGNAECMFDDQTHQSHTAHTTQPVPLLYISNNEHWTFNCEQGNLIDIAPTILALLDIKPPTEMTGKILMNKGCQDENA
jgi:2,3-bisphosphoglycerate-independent phosphoglycerate mutase